MDKGMSKGKEEKKGDRFILFTEFLFPVIKEWFKETVKGVKKEPFNFTVILYMMSYLLLWVYYVMTPVLQSMDKYSELGDAQDPIIILSLAGFLWLSLWFVATYLSWISARYTIKLAVKVVNAVR